MRKVVVDKDGMVINAIEIKDGANWKPPEGCRLLDKARSNKVDIGDKIVGNTLIKHSFTDREGKVITPVPIPL